MGASDGTAGNAHCHAGGRIRRDTGGPDTDELEKIKNMAKNRVGINEIMLLQKQYEESIRRNSRVLGIGWNKRILVASNSSY